MLMYFPFIVIGLILVAGIVTVLTMMRKKKQPPTAASIPPIPSTQEAQQHFTSGPAVTPTVKPTPVDTSHPTPTMSSPAAAAPPTIATASVLPQSHMGKANRTKQIAILGGVGAVIAVIAVISFFLTQRKPLPSPKPHAQVVGIHNLCGVEVQTTEEWHGNTYTNTFTVINTNDYPITVSTREEVHVCAQSNANACQDPGQTTTNEFQLAPAGDPSGADKKIVTLQGVQPAGACGSFQNDLHITSIIPPPRSGTPPSCSSGGNPAFGFESYPNSCQVSGSPTPPPVATPTTALSPTPGAGPFRVIGVVKTVNVPPAPPTPNQCVPDASQKPAANIQIQLQGGSLNQFATSDANGKFEFDNVAGNGQIYNVCTIAPFPAPISGRYCAFQHDSSRPITAQCDKITVNSDVTDVFLVLQIPASTSPTDTPVPSTTIAPAFTPTPTLTLTPTTTPAPTATGVPAATNTPTPTPTTISIAGANTPTPTEIILAQTSTTPTAASPSIPASGNPIPVVAIGLPLFLIALAFLL